MTHKNPYSQYEKHQLWKIISDSLQELKQNNDLLITTNEDLVVGYLVKEIVSKNK